MKSIITVKCPGCRGELEIDVSREKVISHKRFVDLEAPEKDKAEIFDDAVKRAHSREDEAARAFERAREEQRESESKLDALFGEMKKKVEEQKKKGIDPDEGDPRKLFWD
ncbi:MAG: hypothetical protein R3F20_14240 [Planctomycetota bacterium]